MSTNRSFTLNNETDRPISRYVNLEGNSAQPSNQNTKNDVHLEQGTNTTVNQFSMNDKVNKLNLFEVLCEIFVIFIQ